MPPISKIYIFTGLAQNRELPHQVRERLQKEKNIGDCVEVVVDFQPKDRFLEIPYNHEGFWQNSNAFVLLNIKGGISTNDLLKLAANESFLPPALKSNKPWLILFYGMSLEPVAQKEIVFANYRELLNSGFALEAMSFRQAVDIVARRLIESKQVEEVYEIDLKQV